MAKQTLKDSSGRILGVSTRKVSIAIATCAFAFLQPTEILAVTEETVIPELRVPSGTLHGDDVFKNVRVTAVLPDGLKISHDGGISKIPFERLPQDLRSKYKFDAGAAAAFRTKIEAQQAEANLAISQQKATQTPSPQKRTAGTSANAGMNPDLLAVAKSVGAEAVPPDTWAAELAGVVPTFERGKAYAISGLWVKKADNSALLAGFDPTSLAQMAFVASQKGGFSQVNIPPASEVPISIGGVGVFEQLVPMGRGKIPVFRCLFLQVDGKEAYKVPDQSKQ